VTNGTGPIRGGGARSTHTDSHIRPIKR